jgi:hypothetical protein
MSDPSQQSTSGSSGGGNPNNTDISEVKLSAALRADLSMQKGAHVA